MNDMNEQLLTLSEASKILKVHPRTISRWARNGKVTLVFLPIGNRPRITKSEVDRLMTPDKKENQD
jgi:putative resolvase